MRNRYFILLFLLILFLVFLFQFFVASNEMEVIVTGTGNPGKIMIYAFDGPISSYKRSEIDTGYNLVWTVRIGDVYNKGKNVIVAGVGNSFFSTPYGCQIVAYELAASGWKKDVIDSNVDLRCKDIAIGDVYNEGKNAIVLGTHGEGIIRVYKWDGTKWNRDEIERNFIGQIDSQQNTNHRVPVEKLTYSTVDQTSIHMVKIADVQNDGKNEIVATESSPLEYTSGPPISFVNVYSFVGKKWSRTTIHDSKGLQDRSILVDDIDYSGKNKILIGAVPGKLFLLNDNGNWSSTLIFNQSYDKNMKGLDFQDIYSKGRKQIVLATGVPGALVYNLEWDGSKFQPTLIGNVSQIFEKYTVIKGLNYNSLDVKAKDIDNDGKLEIIVGGEADTSLALDKIKPQDNIFGWETTPYGFLIIYKYDESQKTWNPQILDQNSV